MPANLWKRSSALALMMPVLLFGVNATMTSTLPTGMYAYVDGGYGPSELTLLAGGRYTDGDEGSISVEGSYTLMHDQIIFVEQGPADAPCLHLSGRYKWRLDGKILELSEVKDSCPTRQNDWGSGVLIKQP